MPYRKPTAEEFELQDNNRVIHKPTGARFSRYPAPTLSTNMWINRKQAGDGLPDGERYWEDIKIAAQKLLFPK
jgi:hypothetical protein